MSPRRSFLKCSVKFCHSGRSHERPRKIGASVQKQDVSSPNFVLWFCVMKIPKSLFRVLLTSVFAASTLFFSISEASVVVAGTRVIYNAKDREVTLKLSNNGASPALTQVWLDNGDAKEDPSKLDLPFVRTPALARIDPQKSQTIRISYTGEALPQDRETPFCSGSTCSKCHRSRPLPRPAPITFSWRFVRVLSSSSVRPGCKGPPTTRRASWSGI